MKNEAKQIVVACLICVLLLAGVGYWCWQGIHYRPEARQEMRNLMAQIQLGDTKAQVQQKFKSGSYKVLLFRTNRGANLWSVSTPFEFGAGNWILYLEFDKDKVIALRLRVADSITMRPREQAPPDKVHASWPEEFPRQ